MAKCNYVAPEVFVLAFSFDDLVRTSGEQATIYGNEGAWNNRWTPTTNVEEDL